HHHEHTPSASFGESILISASNFFSFLIYVAMSSACTEMHHITANEIHLLSVNIPKIWKHGTGWFLPIIIFIEIPIYARGDRSPVVMKRHIFPEQPTVIA